MREESDSVVYFDRDITMSPRPEMAISSGKLDRGGVVKAGMVRKQQEDPPKSIARTPEKEKKGCILRKHLYHNCP